ncbi:MAG: glycoside hydrolase family 75 protein [Polyangiaceae bacterium]
MRNALALALAVAFGLLAACSSSSSPDDPGSSDASTLDDSGSVGDSSTDLDSSVAVDASAPHDAGAVVDAGDQIAQLLALTSKCAKPVSTGLLALNAGNPGTVAVCGLTGALFWKADMDIDCDGKQTTQCNTGTDPDYQNSTAAVDSKGNALDAANLPYVVVPGKSAKFDAAAAGLSKGAVILVVYKNQLAYAVYGDVGPAADIGEASYATASELGINPNPSKGGVDGADVLYVAFTGSDSVVKPKIEDHAAAVTLGKAKLTALLGN